MSRIIRWLLAGAVLVAASGGSTYAYLTDSATNAENIFRVGTVDVSLDPTSTAFNVAALAPGGQASAVLGVKNGGSLPFTFTMAARKTAGYSAVYDVLTCTVTSTEDSSTVYSGLLSALASTPRAVLAGATENVRITVGLPGTVGNDVGDKYCKVSFDVAAEQVH